MALYTGGFSFLLMGMWFTAKEATVVAPQPSILNLFHKASRPSLEYADFVSILLTGLGLMIALGAFFIAIMAVWGYKEAKELVVRTAEDRAKAEAIEQLPRLLTPELIISALKSDPSLLITATRETNETLFGDVDQNEAEEIVEALDGDADERT
ncbi:hypothetical protein VB618_06190 [Microvirga sp. CF3062]|uniref:hypothetical protein n=1 Tax=Microvirga sp. CF3062 TaxID=3110182 RepID=UPI002E764351|nr:hypothetical protein [Microvirga sp. CF3062]MEE1655777.1 hypothetical protein [Microvirga sp. CF3062]